MAELTPLVEAWIRYADDDWQDSQILASAGGNPRNICFHLQQCIEKLLRAELMRLQSPVPKTHNLKELSFSRWPSGVRKFPCGASFAGAKGARSLLCQSHVALSPGYQHLH